MKKTVLILLLVCILSLCLAGCKGQEDAVTYAAEHRHVYGFWYDAEDGTQVRYCKICHESETQEKP